MVSSLSRVLLRRTANVTRTIGRSTSRFESTATKATETTPKTSNVVDRISQVTSTAGPALSGAVNGLGRALSKIGGRTGTIIAFTQQQVPRVIYYARVGLELGKLVFHGQNMTPPSMSTFQAHFHRLIEKARNPNTLLASGSPAELIQRARNVSNNQLAHGAVLLAEVLGFFTVGEILGRFKLVGYQGQTAHH
ncbi:hypothetical protein K3495_g2413 [Podosphaera aphanis]|nr:hypothetical protein K3495_g2413 [Podosphaera aphanis]